MHNTMTNPDIQERKEACKHDGIQTWRMGDGTPAGMWSCVQCGAKFVPLAQAEAMMTAERAEIERLRAALRFQDERDGRIGTHGPTCYGFGHRHYECALTMIERMRPVVKSAVDSVCGLGSTDGAIALEDARRANGWIGA